MIDLAQLTAMLGEEPAEQQAVLAWTGEPLGTEWTDEQATELVALWHNTSGMPWEKPNPHIVVLRDDEQELTYDECTALGLDGTGRDGNPRFPYTEEKLTRNEAATLKAYRDSAATCNCESSFCPDHSPATAGSTKPVYCPNRVDATSPAMLHVGNICVACATAVVAHDGHFLVSQPYGTWDGE